MSSPKAETAQMLAKLPEDSTFEDIQYHLFVLEKVHRGHARVADEGEVAHEAAKQRLSKWLEG